MATYCFSTGPLLRGAGVLVAKSLLELEPSPKGEDPPDRLPVATAASSICQLRPSPIDPARQQERGNRSFIASPRRTQIPVGSPSRAPAASGPRLLARGARQAEPRFPSRGPLD